MDTLRLKTVLSLLLIAVGAVSVPFFVTNTDASSPQASGFLIDFGDWNVTWTKMEVPADPYEALSAACRENGFTHTVEEGLVKEINGTCSTDAQTWDLWTISRNSLTWVKEDSPQRADLSRYTIAAWAYCSNEDTPTVAVDESGRSIYGYKQAQRTISLSPALTEIMGAMRAVQTLVGTDRYSNYPDAVVAAQNEGKIKIIGDFLNPSFELIIGQRPDIVFCDGSLYTHHQMADRLRNTSVNAVLMYGGESIRDIMSNIYIAGVAIGYEMRAAEVISSLKLAMHEIVDALDTSPVSRNVKVMNALSPDKSPWITGSGTFIDDISSTVKGDNVFLSQSGWVQINSERIMAANPSVIIILTTDYPATKDAYDRIYGSLSAEWRATEAYKTGKIYLITESAGAMSQCPSPRLAQMVEITARILHPEVFTDKEMPKFIGDDYEEYLTFTKYLGFND